MTGPILNRLIPDVWFRSGSGQKNKTQNILKTTSDRTSFPALRSHMVHYLQMFTHVEVPVLCLTTVMRSSEGGRGDDSDK